MNREIEINYNGHPTSVTSLTEHVYYVHLTNSPYKIKRVSQAEGHVIWHEVETEMQTPLSQMIGKLIEERLLDDIGSED